MLEISLRLAIAALEDAYDTLHSDDMTDSAQHDLSQLARAITIVEDLQQAQAK